MCLEIGFGGILRFFRVCLGNQTRIERNTAIWEGFFRVIESDYPFSFLFICFFALLFCIKFVCIKLQFSLSDYIFTILGVVVWGGGGGGG